MKILISPLLVVIMVVSSYWQATSADESKDGLNIRKIYLTKYVPKRGAVETTDKRVTLTSDQNPYKAKDTDLIHAIVVLSPKIAKGSGAGMVLYSIVAGKKEYIADIGMAKLDHTYEDTKKTVRMFSFCLTKKYFDHAVVNIWTGGLGENHEEFTLHLHAKKQAEDVAPDS